MTPKEQKELKKELSSKTPPTHIKAIDPNDPEFLKSKTLTEVEPPSEILLDLLPYQKEGYGWMTAQEAVSSHHVTLY